MLPPFRSLVGLVWRIETEGWASATTGADRFCLYSTKQETGYFWRVSGLLLYGIISCNIMDGLVMLLGIMGRGIATDFFSDPPDFGADRLNK